MGTDPQIAQLLPGRAKLRPYGPVGHRRPGSGQDVWKKPLADWERCLFGFIMAHVRIVFRELPWPWSSYQALPATGLRRTLGIESLARPCLPLTMLESKLLCWWICSLFRVYAVYTNNGESRSRLARRAHALSRSLGKHGFICCCQARLRRLLASCPLPQLFGDKSTNNRSCYQNLHTPAGDYLIPCPVRGRYLLPRQIILYRKHHCRYDRYWPVCQ